MRKNYVDDLFTFNIYTECNIRITCHDNVCYHFEGKGFYSLLKGPDLPFLS